MKEQIQELEARLAHATDSKDRVDIINDLAWLQRGLDKKRSRSLCEQAHNLSISETAGSENYLPGIMGSVRTLSYLSILEGNFSQAMILAEEAMEVEKKCNDPIIRFDCLITFFWGYYYQTMYAEALDILLKASEIEKNIDDISREAVINGALGVLYREIGDKELAVEKITYSIELYTKLKDWRGLAGAYNNLAFVFHALKKYPLAVETALKGIEITRKYGVQVMYEYLCDTLGEIYLEMNDFANAILYLQELISNAHKVNSRYTELVSRLHLGEVLIRKGDVADAQSSIEHSLQIASDMKDTFNICKSHELLSAIREKAEDYDQALIHYKKYHELRELLNSEDVDKKLSYLKTQHEAETARRNVEIYRLKNIALKREIEHHKQIRTSLEERAFFDPLTGLFNRRQASILIQQNFDYAITTKSSFCILMIDIDKFKIVNDTYGHTVGDEVLVATAHLLQKSLRQKDIVGRFGGEEFILGLRLSVKISQMIAERICASFADTPLETQKGALSITVSIGIAELHASGSTSLDMLIKCADEALYRAKNNGRNQAAIHEPHHAATQV